MLVPVIETCELAERNDQGGRDEQRKCRAVTADGHCHAHGQRRGQHVGDGQAPPNSRVAAQDRRVAPTFANVTEVRFSRSGPVGARWARRRWHLHLDSLTMLPLRLIGRGGRLRQRKIRDRYLRPCLHQIDIRVARVRLHPAYAWAGSAPTP